MLSNLRAHYDSPLRILRKPSGFVRMDIAPAGAAPAPSSRTAAVDAWATNLAKIMPAETFATYTAFKAYAAPSQLGEFHVIPFVCVIIAVVIRWLTTAPPGTSKPDITAVVLAGFTTVVWIYAQGDWFGLWKGGPVVAYLSAIALGLLAILVPFVLQRTSNNSSVGA